MTRRQLASLLVLFFTASILVTGSKDRRAFWSQWGRTARHTGAVNVSGQPLHKKLADIIYDEFAEQEKAENVPLFGEAVLTAHYQSTLIDDRSFYMVNKTGTYPSCNPAGNWIFGDNCGPNAWNQLQWNVLRYDNDRYAKAVWTFPTDWKPEPNGTNFLSGFGGLVGWEPVFHPALANGYVYVPGAAGTIWKVNRHDGKSVAHIQPLGTSVSAADTFVSSPLTADDRGNIYYNVIQLNVHGNPWNQNDVVNAWLVKVTPHDVALSVAYSMLVPDAPAGTSTNCPSTFFALGDNGASLPWPPSANAVAPPQGCGSQRPGVNIAPAVGRDGTIYSISIAHFDNMVAYLVAVNPDLTPKWDVTLQNRLTDGCGVLLPIAANGVTDMANSCRFGTTVGVDPTTNAKGSGTVSDLASSSPTVLPDGSILFGTTDNYNFSRGHLYHFDANGNYLNAYNFGWDSTAGAFRHDGTFSIVIKDNHYPSAAYCSFASPICSVTPPGPYLVTQLDADLNIEWSFQSTTIDSAHPNGYEWCVNAPVIDADGLVYVTSEDGHVYSLPQGHSGVFEQPKQRIFLKEALGAAYTPLSIGEDGLIYSQNDGHLYLVGRGDD